MARSLDSLQYNVESGKRIDFPKKAPETNNILVYNGTELEWADIGLKSGYNLTSIASNNPSTIGFKATFGTPFTSLAYSSRQVGSSYNAVITGKLQINLPYATITSLFSNLWINTVPTTWGINLGAFITGGVLGKDFQNLYTIDTGNNSYLSTTPLVFQYVPNPNDTMQQTLISPSPESMPLFSFTLSSTRSFTTDGEARVYAMNSLADSSSTTSTTIIPKAFYNVQFQYSF